MSKRERERHQEEAREGGRGCFDTADDDKKEMRCQGGDGFRLLRNVERKRADQRRHSRAATMMNHSLSIRMYYY